MKIVGSYAADVRKARSGAIATSGAATNDAVTSGAAMTTAMAGVVVRRSRR